MEPSERGLRWSRRRESWWPSEQMAERDGESEQMAERDGESDRVERGRAETDFFSSFFLFQ
jgi:hypothetical protein